MSKLIAAALLCLSSSMACAEIRVGTALPFDARVVCQTRQSADAVMAAIKDDGGRAAVQVINKKDDCGLRLMEFTVLRVVGEVQPPSGRSVRLLELDNWARGTFYGFD